MTQANERKRRCRPFTDRSPGLRSNVQHQRSARPDARRQHINRCAAPHSDYRLRHQVRHRVDRFLCAKRAPFRESVRGKTPGGQRPRRLETGSPRQTKPDAGSFGLGPAHSYPSCHVANPETRCAIDNETESSTGIVFPNDDYKRLKPTRNRQHFECRWFIELDHRRESNDKKLLSTINYSRLVALGYKASSPRLNRHGSGFERRRPRTTPHRHSH